MQGKYFKQYDIEKLKYAIEKEHEKKSKCN